MHYIDTQTLEYPLTEHQIRLRHPNTSFPIPFEAPEGFMPVRFTDQPELDRFTHRAVEVAPTLAGGEWVQTWGVVALTPEEAAARVPQVVSMRQARLALLGAGLLDDVEAAIAAIPDPTERRAAQIEWEFGQEVNRQHGLVSMLVPALGLTDAQIDALFIQASQL